MFDESIDKTNHESADEIRHAFVHLGGKYVGRIVPVNKEIDFSSIPGVRMVMPPPSWAKSEPSTDAAPDAPAESVENEDDSRE